MHDFTHNIRGVWVVGTLVYLPILHAYGMWPLCPGSSLSIGQSMAISGVHTASSKERSGPWFNIKMPSYQYWKSYCGDKTVIRLSYLHNGISYTGKTTSLYWFSSLLGVLWLRKVHVNALWPSDVIWWQRSRSTLAQVMACWLVAIKGVLWHSPESNVTANVQDIYHRNKFENY